MNLELTDAREALEERQRQLRIEKYLASGVQLKFGPSPEVRRQRIIVAEQEVVRAFVRVNLLEAKMKNPV
jgi:hypothetical protein